MPFTRKTQPSKPFMTTARFPWSSLSWTATMGQFSRTVKQAAARRTPWWDFLMIQSSAASFPTASITFSAALTKMSRRRSIWCGVPIWKSTWRTSSICSQSRREARSPKYSNWRRTRIRACTLKASKLWLWKVCPKWNEPWILARWIGRRQVRPWMQLRPVRTQFSPSTSKRQRKKMENRWSRQANLTWSILL